MGAPGIMNSISGAKGLMLKDVSLEDLAQAIRALANNKPLFSLA